MDVFLLASPSLKDRGSVFKWMACFWQTLQRGSTILKKPHLDSLVREMAGTLSCSSGKQAGIEGQTGDLTAQPIPGPSK